MAIFKPKTKKMVTVNKADGTSYQRQQDVNVDVPSANSGKLRVAGAVPPPRSTQFDARRQERTVIMRGHAGTETIPALPDLTDVTTFIPRHDGVTAIHRRLDETPSSRSYDEHLADQKADREAYFDHRENFDVVKAPDRTVILNDKAGGTKETVVKGEYAEIPRDDNRVPGDVVIVDGKEYVLQDRLPDDYIENGMDGENERRARAKRLSQFEHRQAFDLATAQPVKVQIGNRTVTKAPVTIEVPRDNSRQPGDSIEVDGVEYKIQERLPDDYVDGTQ